MFSFIVNAEESGFVTLTFDDGYSCAYDHALPVLQKNGAQATFYITTQLLGQPGYLTKDQVKELKDHGQEIGSHGFTHRKLTTLSSQEVREELSTSKSMLEEITQAPVNHFAPPYGSVSRQVTRLIKEFYHSIRLTRSGKQQKHPLPVLIKARIVFSTTTLEDFDSWLQLEAARKGWLVLVYHHIDWQENALSVSPDVLNEHIKLIKAHDLQIVTIGE